MTDEAIYEIFPTRRRIDPPTAYDDVPVASRGDMVPLLDGVETVHDAIDRVLAWQERGIHAMGH